MKRKENECHQNTDAHEQHQEENGANEQCYENTEGKKMLARVMHRKLSNKLFIQILNIYLKMTTIHFFLTNYQMLFSTNKRHESRNQSNNNNINNKSDNIKNNKMKHEVKHISCLIHRNEEETHQNNQKVQ